MKPEEALKDILAFVYLHRENDEKNRCLISSSELIFIIKGHLRRFELEHIRSLSFRTKLLLLPIVSGGTFGPFFFIALIGNYFHPILSLSGFLVSLFLFYYGFTGQHTIKVTTHNDVYEVMIPKVSENLRLFVDFCKTQISTPAKETFYYFIPLNKDEKSALFQQAKWTLPENGVFAFDAKSYRDNLKKQRDPNIFYLKIDVRQENVQVRYEKDEHGIVRPRIFGEIRSFQQKEGNS